MFNNPEPTFIRHYCSVPPHGVNSASYTLFNSKTCSPRSHLGTPLIVVTPSYCNDQHDSPDRLFNQDLFNAVPDISPASASSTRNSPQKRQVDFGEEDSPKRLKLDFSKSCLASDIGSLVWCPTANHSNAVTDFSVEFDKLNSLFPAGAGLCDSTTGQLEEPNSYIIQSTLSDSVSIFDSIDCSIFEPLEGTFFDSTQLSLSDHFYNVSDPVEEEDVDPPLSANTTARDPELPSYLEAISSPPPSLPIEAVSSTIRGNASLNDTHQERERELSCTLLRPPNSLSQINRFKGEVGPQWSLRTSVPSPSKGKVRRMSRRGDHRSLRLVSFKRKLTEIKLLQSYLTLPSISSVSQKLFSRLNPIVTKLQAFYGTNVVDGFGIAAQSADGESRCFKQLGHQPSLIDTYAAIPALINNPGVSPGTFNALRVLPLAARVGLPNPLLVISSSLQLLIDSCYKAAWTLLTESVTSIFSSSLLGLEPEPPPL
ncbi:CYFA0S01e17821g1_1 [Cyberlindnera fabianii]|uniref:CYFA0S01e17821g1_1 n=1 Tax=Cyberlindnera fabianii TaxID=36022 RepID=A0A061ASX1_CYBFA|nr:CYFA0S01e17821g1_1 [Cyberlindnera fabianii]